MVAPLIKYTGAHCHKCGKETIMCYDVRDRQVPFVVRSTTTMKDILQYTNNTTLSYMKCQSCGCMFLIDYSLGYARPVSAAYIRSEFFIK